MHTRSDNSVRQDENVLLFRKLPLVCHKVPFVKPIICLNIPSIDINRYEAGFTLVELIITLTIAGILAALAVPAMQTFILDQRLTTQANDFIADLSTARSEAVKRGSNVVVCNQGGSVASPSCGSGASWASGRVIFVDSIPSSGNGVLDNGEAVLRVQQPLEGNNTLNSIGGTTSSFVFAGTGLTTLSSGEITMRFCDNRVPSQAVNVYVNYTGRTRTDRATGVSCS